MTTSPNSSGLLVLAERVEAATADEQRQIIENAVAQLALARLWPPRADDTELVAKFFAFLNVGAFESAAMTLVPEGWRVDQIGEWADETLRAMGSWYAILSPPGKSPHGVNSNRCQHAATPALALTAACLRALASGGA